MTLIQFLRFKIIRFAIIGTLLPAVTSAIDFKLSMKVNLKSEIFKETFRWLIIWHTVEKPHFYILIFTRHSNGKILDKWYCFPLWMSWKIFSLVAARDDIHFAVARCIHKIPPTLKMLSFRKCCKGVVVTSSYRKVSIIFMKQSISFTDKRHAYTFSFRRVSGMFQILSWPFHFNISKQLEAGM